MHPTIFSQLEHIKKIFTDRVKLLSSGLLTGLNYFSDYRTAFQMSSWNYNALPYMGYNAHTFL